MYKHIVMVTIVYPVHGLCYSYINTVFNMENYQHFNVLIREGMGISLLYTNS